MEQIQVLNKESFKEIYKNEKLRNAVAFAHSVCNERGEEEFKKALLYPISYKVNPEQIYKANSLRLKRQKEVLKENKHNLLFCGMGMNFNPTIKDGIGNHRIRTTFLNSDGIKCFIELGTTAKDDNLRIDFAIYDYLEGNYKISLKEKDKRQKYNYKNLERETPILKYTYENVLNLVNKYFNCNFKKMVVDYYNVDSNVLCISPKILK
jgi:hypothetical protein